jgi:hypothetical protein
MELALASRTIMPRFPIKKNKKGLGRGGLFEGGACLGDYKLILLDHGWKNLYFFKVGTIMQSCQT